MPVTQSCCGSEHPWPAYVLQIRRAPYPCNLPAGNLFVKVLCLIEFVQQLIGIAIKGIVGVGMVAYYMAFMDYSADVGRIFLYEPACDKKGRPDSVKAQCVKYIVQVFIVTACI